MALDKKAVQAWKAEYELINEMEREELKVRLATETVEQSIRSYFAMCQLAIALAGSTDVPPELQEARERHYIELADKWKRLSERLKSV
jgi:hypothetical protein